jgi:diaminopimelate epimerase
MATVHTVVFVEDEFDDYERAGKELCFSPLFANQTNVNFVTVLDDGHLKVRTYERGCGLTLACGSGICASAQAARLLGLCKDHVQVQAALGSLTIDMDGPDTYMSGPAQFVCKGDYAL